MIAGFLVAERIQHLRPINPIDHLSIVAIRRSLNHTVDAGENGSTRTDQDA